MTSLLPASVALKKQSALYGLAAKLITPIKAQTPDEWGAQHRVYPPSSGVPGPRNPSLTPYVIPVERAVAAGRFQRVVFVTAAQSGKTDLVLDVIGHKLDTRPVPILYVGPSKEFLTDQFEPRLMGLFDEAATLSHKVVRGRSMKKTLKRVSGVPVRLAHAGSSTALKSDPAAFAAVDEYDEMMANIRGQGDPLGLVEARGVTYADFCALITSTPSQGAKETEKCSNTGLEFWKVLDPDEINSPIWKLWQEGTRYHWAWPCKHCDEYFIPRFSLLTWPKDATPSQARRATSMCCPHCGGIHDDDDKAEMNAKGLYVAPGMTIDRHGVVSGEPPETSTASFWASGLASPFVSWGERVERYLKALASGESDKVQTAVNAGFGETFIPAGGDVPSWEEVLHLRTPVPRRTVPLEALFLTAGVDVQGNGLYYTVRGWGSRAQSWLIDHGIMWGDTSMPDVWNDLGQYLTQPIDGLYIKVAYVDSGFRPGKKFIVPENRVYEFCRQYRRFVYPTKGRATISNDLWIRVSRIEVNTQGKAASYGLDLVLINTDKAKSFVHERLHYPMEAKGSFLLHAEADEDYAKQIVAEARVKKPSGGFDWVPVYRENHFLDCEAQAAAAAYHAGVFRLPDGARREPPSDEPDEPPPAPEPNQPPPRRDSSRKERFANFAARLND